MPKLHDSIQKISIFPQIQMKKNYKIVWIIYYNCNNHRHSNQL